MKTKDCTPGLVVAYTDWGRPALGASNARATIIGPDTIKGAPYRSADRPGIRVRLDDGREPVVEARRLAGTWEAHEAAVRTHAASILEQQTVENARHDEIEAALDRLETAGCDWHGRIYKRDPKYPAGWTVEFMVTVEQVVALAALLETGKAAP